MYKLTCRRFNYVIRKNSNYRIKENTLDITISANILVHNYDRTVCNIECNLSTKLIYDYADRLLINPKKGKLLITSGKIWGKSEDENKKIALVVKENLYTELENNLIKDLRVIQEGLALSLSTNF